MNVIKRLYLQYVGWEKSRSIPLSTENCIVLLKYNKDNRVRRMAATGLATHYDDWHLVVDALIDALRSPEGPFWECQRSLASLGVTVGEPVIDKLIHALEDENKYVRWRVAETLGTIGSNRWIEPTPKMKGYGNKKAIEPLKKLLYDEDEHVRYVAKIALKDLDW